MTDESALQLMYAAHKYMIPNLVKFCEQFLEDGLNDENICCILEQSLTFGAEVLKKRCLALIVLNSCEILKSKQFNEINAQTLDAILDMDRMECSESFLYQACIGWAKHQLKNNEEAQNPSDQAIRDALGRLLYKIRFPAMDQKEFTEFTADSDVLSPQEKLSIFYFLANGKKKETFAFICQKRRKCSEKFCCRQTGFSTQFGHSFMRQNNTGHNETLTFKTSHSILLTGIQLIPCNASYSQCQHKFTVSISYKKDVITNQLIEATADPSTGQNKLVLTQPTFVTKGRDYMLTVTCSCTNTGLYSYYGMPVQHWSAGSQLATAEQYYEEETCSDDVRCDDDVRTVTITFPGPVRNQNFVSGLYYKS